MFRLAFIFVFVAGVFCSGCRTFHPEVRATYQKYGMIKLGMTYSQVYAILPPTGTIRTADGREMEQWFFGRNTGEGADSAYLEVIFGADGRVNKANRSIEHVKLSPPPTLVVPNQSRQN